MQVFNALCLIPPPKKNLNKTLNANIAVSYFFLLNYVLEGNKILIDIWFNRQNVIYLLRSAHLIYKSAIHPALVSTIKGKCIKNIVYFLLSIFLNIKQKFRHLILGKVKQQICIEICFSSLVYLTYIQYIHKEFNIFN